MNAQEVRQRRIEDLEDRFPVQAAEIRGLANRDIFFDDREADEIVLDLDSDRRCRYGLSAIIGLTTYPIPAYFSTKLVSSQNPSSYFAGEALLLAATAILHLTVRPFLNFRFRQRRYRDALARQQIVEECIAKLKVGRKQ